MGMAAEYYLKIGNDEVLGPIQVDFRVESQRRPMETYGGHVDFNASFGVTMRRVANADLLDRADWMRSGGEVEIEYTVFPMRPAAVLVGRIVEPPIFSSDLFSGSDYMGLNFKVRLK
jgi:hypothetical protein